MAPPHRLLTVILTCAIVTTALQLPLTRRNIPSSLLAKRYTKDDTSLPDDPFNFRIFENVLYATTLHINGQPFQINMDTGSSDLFLDTTGVDLNGATNTGHHVGLIYGDFSRASGNLTLIDMTWGNFTVENQIFINAPGTNATAAGTDGLLGLGPPALSQILKKVQSENLTVNGNPLLQNVFDSEPEKSNFITFRLTRNIAGVVDGGDFTIGEVVPGYERILSTPKLPVHGDRWITFMDALIINGKRVTAPTLGYDDVQVPEGKMTAIFDTGIQYNVAPRSIVDALFKDIPGATLEDGAYILPCDAKLNVSLVFGDMEYPIHPIDLVTPAAMNNSELICIGAVAPIGEGTKGTGDFQFGDAVMRNIYTLFDYGNWSRTGDTSPYMQLLSLTDTDKAWSEFEVLQTKRIKEYFAANFNLSSFEYPDAEDKPSTSNLATPTLSAIRASMTTQASSMSSAISSTRSVPTSKELAVGALSNNDNDNVSDLGGLIRNSYIIIGLLAFVILMLAVAVIVNLTRRKAPRSRVRDTRESTLPLKQSEVYGGPTGRYSD